MPQAIHISPIDNVVVALHPIAKGTLVEVDGLAVTALEDIPQGHKMAVKPIKNGENVTAVILIIKEKHAANTTILRIVFFLFLITFF